MISKILKQLFRNKFTTIITLLVVIIVGYFGYQVISGRAEDIRYTLVAAEKGTLIVSVSGSGQVSALDQVDIKSKVKSEILAVYVEKGEEVKEGKIIAKLDNEDYQKAVEDAEFSLETVKIELEELLSPPDELTLFKAENAVLQAKNSLEKLKFNQEKEYQNALEDIQEAEDNIEKAYEDTLNTVTDAFWDLSTIITGTRDILYDYEIAESEKIISDYDWNISVYQNSFKLTDRDSIKSFIENAESDYKLARESYDPNFENYQNASYYSEKEALEDLLNETIATSKLIAQAIKSEVNLIGYVVDYFSNQDLRVYSNITSYQSDLKSYSSKINSILSNVLSIQRSLEDSREVKLNAEQNLAEIEKTYPLDLTAAEINLEEKEKSLAEIIAGPDELEIRAKKNVVQQKENALIAAQQDLSDCYIVAPIDGIVTDIKVEKDDLISAGAIVANIITKQEIAEIAFNEIDAANIKTGQKVTLTFDALPEATISGEVIEVDTVGIVNQGVVSYGVKITLDTEIEEVKPGMSITADIIIEAKQDVLVLPNSAIKSEGEYYYVELADVSEEMKQQLLANVSGAILPTLPKLQPIEIGLASDFSTEIVAGLQEGDVVISSTINPSAAQSAQTRTTQNQGFQIPGMSSGGGSQIPMRSFNR